MKIQIKITGIEIIIEDEAIALAAGAAPAAMTTATAQSLEQVVTPLITPHANGKVITPRKPRAVVSAPETKAATSEPLPPAITEPPTDTGGRWSHVAPTDCQTLLRRVNRAERPCHRHRADPALHGRVDGGQGATVRSGQGVARGGG